MNRLIIIEGTPCSGKSTTSKYIADKTDCRFFDEGSGRHPADYEFHAFIDFETLNAFSADEQEQIKQNSEEKSGGYVVPLEKFSGELFDMLLKYKIYDFLPWEIEKPVMLDKWREFVKSAVSGERYIFNCVLLQNPMCETMMRFGFDIQKSSEYINEICDIIKPLDPFVIYLHSDNIRNSIERTLSERGNDWLNSVIDYHCNGAYGKANCLTGFDGYISALEERQRREIKILHDLNVKHLIINEPQDDWKKAYSLIDEALINHCSAFYNTTSELKGESS